MLIVAVQVVGSRDVPFVRGPVVVGAPDGSGVVAAFWAEDNEIRGPTVDVAAGVAAGELRAVTPGVLPSYRVGCWWFGGRTANGILGELPVGAYVVATRNFPDGCVLLVKEAESGLRAARDRYVHEIRRRGMTAHAQGDVPRARKNLELAWRMAREPDAQVEAALASLR